MITSIRQHNPSRLAITGLGQTLSYGELVSRMEATAEKLTEQAERSGTAKRPLVFLAAMNTVDSIVAYLACLDADVPVCLIEPETSYLSQLVACYAPALLLLPPDVVLPDEGRNLSDSDDYEQGEALPDSSYRMYRRANTDMVTKPHPSLALLLQTSGSTGDPKLVRLTRHSVFSNAHSIAEYLALSPDERSIQGLPMNYSYGLSLINSHLVAGGTIVLTSHSFMRPEFWHDVEIYGCTSFAGVPFMYETLHRLRFDPSRYKSLRTMTQAGGKLRVDLVEAFYHKMQAVGGSLCIMYGQTEATARIAYVPPHRLGEKSGSIGIPIPRGQITLEPVDGSENDPMRQLVYTGPNVMMGYAESATDLERGDELGGVLHTGDLATVDDEGYYTIVGRLKRFAKLFGRRINLADIETNLEATFPLRAAALDAGDSKLLVYAEPSGEIDLAVVRNYLAKQLNVTPTAIAVQTIDALPFTSSGKKDYKRLPQ